MKKRNKWLLGIGALVLGAYAFWPSNDKCLESKVVETIEQLVRIKPRINLEKINEILAEVNKPKTLEQEINDEDLDLPSCLKCKYWKPKVKKEFYENGQLKSVKTTNCDELHGEQLTYWDNRRLNSSINYFCGKKEGVEKFWYNNGQLARATNYVNGVKEGLRSGYCPNGQLLSETDYINGVKEGVEREWYRNGDLLSRGKYFYGKKHGLFERWNKKGILTFSVEYKYGKRHGYWRLFDYGSNLIKEKYYINGMLQWVKTSDTKFPFSYPLEEQDLIEEGREDLIKEKLK